MKYIVAFLCMVCVAFSLEIPRLVPLSKDEPHFLEYRVIKLENHLKMLSDQIHSLKFADQAHMPKIIDRIEKEIDQCMYLIGVKELIFSD